MRDHDDERIRNFELANLITYAHHNPKKMPRYKPTEDKAEVKSDALAQAQVTWKFLITRAAGMTLLVSPMMATCFG